MGYEDESETPLSIAERTRLVGQLEQAGWSGPASDIAEGQSPERVLKSLEEVGEIRSSGAEIVEGYCE
jgi:hypothetical protein